MLSQRYRTQRVEIGRITLISIRIVTQRIRFCQIILFLFLLFDLPTGILLRYLTIFKRSCIAAIYYIPQEPERTFYHVANRQKFIWCSHFPQLQQIIETKHLGTTGKTDLTNTPHVIANHHIATNQLETLAFRNKTNLILPVKFRSHYRINIIGIVFFRIASQGRKQFIVKQRRRIYINMKVLQQPAVSFPKFRSSTHTSLYLLVINIRSRKMQITVSLHHIFVHPLPYPEHCR